MRLLHSIDAAQVKQMDVYRAILTSADKTQLYMKTFAKFRECFWLNNSILASATAGGGERRAAPPSALNAFMSICGEFKEAAKLLMGYIEEWRHKYPEEAEDWQIIGPSPKLYTRPNFFADAKGPR